MYAADFVDTESREGPESLAAVPVGPGRASDRQKSHAIHKHE